MGTSPPSVNNPLSSTRITTDFLFMGAIQKNGDPLYRMNARIRKAETLLLPASSLRVIHHCTMGDQHFISVPDPEDINYHVSSPAIFMVQTASLTILSLATKGRVSPKRLWRLCMYQGFSEQYNVKGLRDLDYHPGIHDPREQNYPPPIPGFSVQQVIALESLGDIELVKNAIIHKGQFWV